MDFNAVYLVGGMAIVTYLPRVIPVLFGGRKSYPAKVEQFLSYLPFGILGALIFPGVLTSAGSATASGAGLIIAVVLAWNKAPLVLVVAGSIVAAALTSAWLG